ncbi:hypothetical protein COO60DRAFT_958464 [Scenedesmus sp. NREL 46B-D3]|nr:hypothetical protein COO60DRAFT_958464 [Scenedesmus sp. NREL 46B-D3]
MRKGVPVYGSRSCRCSRLVRELQQRVEQRTAELHDLTAENTSLKQRQELLFSSIGQQADVLHYASKIIELLQQTSSAASDDCAHAQATATALVHERKAQQLLAELEATNTCCNTGSRRRSSNSGNRATSSAAPGSSTSSDSDDEGTAAAAAASSTEQLYTTQLLREVFTPDRVLKAQAMDLEDLVAQLCKLTFRMAFQLNVPASRAALLSSSLEATLHEYA